ncbi:MULTISPECIES: ParA family protein [unclassified Tolypothrix]|uniref:ParA family protein n=1 Tax=unclassified Tolypothrix TaxID=2649714 RepID=UPI0005EAAC5A|nr:MULTISPECIES: AAA family ATPase [unclassified Tolypothrix]BAY95655.1 cobyrinic acid a,c-diamide synthase [Microchaete diplosiphon NIES-3275]EKE96334.1 CobQ/CobB/MinD/ParA nucleotide binding domain protein [Tolypothrix sp. PCC 7601]MBE9083554.1 ParA family protein [Tolypothrix sp. LEGE 11397]UYD30929.1 ParA family protein [Tolypothrix sp. PCC 7712]UYD38774.1 ParA family protein [Tolypothrix sp. PCC 7601]
MSSSNQQCRIIALFNQAGGVAKSTLTQNLGYHLAKREHRVLLIDIDPQASLTKFMGLVPSQLQKTVADAIINEQPLPIHEDIHGMDLAPANRVLSGAEMQLVSAAMRDFRLKEAIEPVLDEYDFILIDCPPSLGLLSYISLVAATHVLVPVETHLKAFEGTDELLQTITHVKNKANRKIQIAGFVPTRYAHQNSADKRALAAITEQLSAWGRIFPAIPRATAFVDATEERAPLAVFDPKHSVVTILEEIANSLEAL